MYVSLEYPGITSAVFIAEDCARFSQELQNLEHVNFVAFTARKGSASLELGLQKKLHAKQQKNLTDAINAFIA
ncbi:MAG: hypothetical protein Ta2A_23550 [Treponemataceae bacterium]|nr:MAG: hypothetical protein Ta2A_23550 [Treponemataceae bacterium]